MSEAPEGMLAGTRAAYGGVAVYQDRATGTFRGVVSSQSSTMNYTPASSLSGPTVTHSATDAALRTSENQGLSYRFLGWLRRWLE